MQNSNNIFVINEELGIVYKIRKNKIDDISIIGKKGKGPGELLLIVTRLIGSFPRNAFL